MNKILKSFMAVIMACSLVACGTKSDETPAPAEETTQAVEVDEGLLNVTITLPESFFTLMDTTAEDYVTQITEAEDNKFKEVKINDNGSVDITMSKKDYKELMLNLGESIDESLQKIVDDQETFPNIIAAEANKDYTEFTVTLESGELGLTDSFSVISFYMLGGMYQAFDGKTESRVIVKFVDKDGNLIETADSSKMNSEG